MTLFGNWAFKEVMKVKCGCMRRPSSHLTGPYTKRRSGHRHTQRDGHVRTRGEDSVYTPRREASGGTGPALTWIWDFQPPGLGDNTFLLFTPPELLIQSQTVEPPPEVLLVQPKPKR